MSYKTTINILHHYADIAYHPYVIHDIWKYKSSKKLYEYLYINKPILTNTLNFLPTHFRNFGKYVVYENNNHKDFINKIQNMKLGEPRNTNFSEELGWEKAVLNSRILHYYTNHK